MKTPYKAVLVQFDLSGKFYSYHCDIPDIKAGDRVLVVVRDIPAIARIAQIAGLSQAQIERAGQLIHSVVDVSDYEERMERLHTYQEIRNELRAAKEQHDEMFIYQTIAKDNPRVAELLEKLNTIDTLNQPKLENKKDEDVT